MSTKIILTFDECHEKAKKCKSRTEFFKNENTVYEYARKNKWLELVCSHMITNRINHSSVTFEECQNEALKYNTKIEFDTKSRKIYTIAYNRGILDQICQHMTSKYVPKNYWNIFENVKNEALKYSTKTEFRINSGGASNAAKINGWYEKVTSHMRVIGNVYKRCIYLFETELNGIKVGYVGLTGDFDRRKEEHYTKGPVASFMKDNKIDRIKTILIQITEYVSLEEVVILEEKFFQEYKLKGYIMLNTAKTGATGSSKFKFTLEDYINEAKKYTLKSDFFKNSKKMYNNAYKRGFLDQICQHMIEVQKPFGFWDFENVKNEALKYPSKIAFRENSLTAYNTAHKNNWIDLVCSHMVTPEKERKWTFELIQEEALKYNCRSDFEKGSPKAYNSALRAKWMNLVCGYMVKKPNNVPFWTLELCQKEALKYTTRSSFEKGSPGAYSAALKRKWMDQICTHMKYIGPHKNKNI